MNRYGRAWVQRVTQGQAIAQARAMILPRPGAVVDDWGSGFYSLVPSGDGGRTPVDAPEITEWKAVALWIGVETKLDLPRAEFFWRLVSACRHRVVFELAGNAVWVRFSVRCHQNDHRQVRDSFLALYPECRLTDDAANWWKDGELVTFHEVSSEWPGARLPTPHSLPDSPLWACIRWMISIPGELVGFYQSVMEPATLADHWHREIEVSHDLSYLARLLSPQSAMQRTPMQIPSAELRGRAELLAQKANPDLPFFGVTLRCGVVGDAGGDFDAPQFVSALRMQGRALVWRRVCPPPLSLRGQVLACGGSCNAGLLLNSAEVAVLGHILPRREEGGADTQWPVFRENITVAQAGLSGSPVGFAENLGARVAVLIPDEIRHRGTHVVSASGMGKTTLLKHLFLHDCARGNGAAFIDPHGDALRDLMALLPQADRERCVYLNPADGEFSPCWNPLWAPPGADLHRVADDLLSALRRVSPAWGPRLETVLRHALVGLLHVPGSTLLDVFNLVRQKSRESDALRERILAACPDRVVCNFWSHDFLKSYRDAEIASSRHKLLKLVSGGTVSRMLSQPDSRINVQEIMDNGKVLLVDLSGLGAESRGFLGSFLLTLFVVAATRRSDQFREARKPFSIFADEAHLFVGADAFENLMAQTRKFRVSVVLAHQYLSQFQTTQVDALLSAGSTLVGRVDRGDAAILAKDFQGKVTADDISRLRPFEMVGRIGTEIVRFQTPANNDRSDPAAVAAVIEQSRNRYYVPAGNGPLTVERSVMSPGEGSPIGVADLSYDEF